jgi:hypothetical protein
MSDDEHRGEGASMGDEARADAINAAAPKVDLEAIGGVLIAAEVIAEVGEMSTAIYAALRARIRAAIATEDEQTWREYSAALLARCSKRER